MSVFDQLKSMGSLMGLLKDKERLRAVGERVKERLDRASVVGEAGGGAVRVTASGRAKVTSVRLAPALLAGPEGASVAEGLIVEATNEAMEKAQALMKQEFAAAARELGLPDMPGMENLLQS